MCRSLILLFVFVCFRFEAITQNCTNEEIFCSQWMQSELNNLNFGCYSLPSGEACNYSIGTALHNGNMVVILSGFCSEAGGIAGANFWKVFECDGQLLEECEGFSFGFSCNIGDGEVYFNLTDNIAFWNCNDPDLDCGGGNCDVEIEMVQGVTCILPKVISTGQILIVCDTGNGLDDLDYTLGAKATIGYNSHQGCTTTCQQGTPIQLTCVELDQPEVPSCTQVISPGNNEQNVPTTINIIWGQSMNATGYKIKIGTSSNGSEILSLTDVGPSSNYVVSDLPNNTFICITVIPYNNGGEALNCASTCFKTAIASSTLDQAQPEVLFYPIPSKGMVYINVENDIDFSLIDVNGKLLKTFSSDVKKIDMSSYPDGLYYLQYVYNNKYFSSKIILLK